MPATPNTNSPPSIVKVAAASFIGTVIEHVDFFLFGTAAALVFNKVFFPSLTPLLGTLAAYGAFSAAFIGRPIGGVIFGHFGDRLGRKVMLVLSLLMMGLSTFAVGLLPAYEQAGVIAPVLLVITRLIQGIAVGGEWSGAVLMAVEHAPKNKRAFYGSWPQAGIPAGLVLATAAFYLVQLLPHEQMMSWGWRVPFIASAALVIVGLYIRLKITESPAFVEVVKSKRRARLPIAEVFKTSWRGIVVSMMSMAAPNFIFYIATVFSLKYASESLGVERSTILGAICFASLLEVLSMPIVAIAADRFGRAAVLKFGCVLTIAMAWPVFYLIDLAQVWSVYLALIIALPLCHAFTFGPLASFIPEQFEARVRYTGSAIGYHIGGMIHSGPVPFIAASLYAWAGTSWPLAAYVAAGGAITLIAVLSLRTKTYSDHERSEHSQHLGVGSKPSDEMASSAELSR